MKYFYLFPLSYSLLLSSEQADAILHWESKTIENEFKGIDAVSGELNLMK